MWLLPIFGPVAKAALHTFYRFRIAGAAVPREGPALIVANHPNSLLDPAAVVALAGRPVRFLAKAPLFTDPQVGWLIRGAGAIPVYRRSDDPALMEKNDQTFEAAHDALLGGAAVGIFPEGLSHSEPALAPLKTGAARIALGAAVTAGHSFPIVPVGLSLREKASFRSRALAVVGESIPWDDLVTDGPENPAAVRELTARIAAGLRQVTVNLRRWEDAPVVEYVQEIFAAGSGHRTDPATRIRGQREVAEALSTPGLTERDDWAALARDVRRHARVLQALGLRPHQLDQPSAGEAISWTARNLLLLAIAGPIVVLGTVVFFAPYRLTGEIAERGRPEPDIRATFKLLVGAVVYLLWTLLLAGAVAWWGGWQAGILALLGVPVLGFATVPLIDWRRSMLGAARRYLRRARRAELLDELRRRQSDLALRVADLRAELATAAPSDPRG